MTARRCVVLAIALAWGAVASAGAVDERQVCGACHDDLSKTVPRFPHAPVAAGTCSACHNPHVSRFDALLRDRPGPLCGTCHADMAATLSRRVVHEPVALGRCVDCHEPHGGNNADFLVRSGADLCAGCHAEVGQWRERRVQHPPFAAGSCASCHEPHASDHDALATKPGAEICTSCHAPDLAFRSAHGGYPVDRAPCGTCHDPHASNEPGLFRSVIHAPFQGGDCTQCHAFPGSDEPFRPSQPLAELCGACHPDAIDAARAAAFPHVPAGGGDCTACHNPHTAEGRSLLERPQPELCLECHDPGGSASGDAGRFVSHADLECATCHASHGGERPLLFVNEPVELCGACHSHQHSVSHPMGQGTSDPRTGAPLDCLSCHGIHDAPYPKYLHRSGERELCVGCHKDMGAGGGGS